MSHGIRMEPGQMQGSVPPQNPRNPARPKLEALHPEVERACRRISDYLLELAQEGLARPALERILDQLDEGIDDVDSRARETTEQLHEALFVRHLRWSARADTQHRSRVDPYYWG